MFRFFVRAERAWSELPIYMKVAGVVGALLALVLLNAATVLAGGTPDPDPFRWK